MNPEPQSQRRRPSKKALAALRRPTGALIEVLGKDPRPLQELVDQLAGMDLEELRDDELAEVPHNSALGERLRTIDLDGDLAGQLAALVIDFSEPVKKPRKPGGKKTAERVERDFPGVTELMEAGFALVGASNPEHSVRRLKAQPIETFCRIGRELIDALEALPAEKQRAPIPGLPFTRLLAQLRWAMSSLERR